VRLAVKPLDRRAWLLVAIALVPVALLSGTANGGSGLPLPLKEVALLPLPGPANRFDYQSLDPSTHLLWIAHMNAGELLAFDVRSRKVVFMVPAPGAHGVIAVPALGRVFATATDEQQVLTIDSHTGKVLARAPAAEYPDGLTYDPNNRRVYVTDEAGGIESVIDAAGRRIATISLSGYGGNIAYDAGSHQVLVDVQNLNEVAVINPSTNRITRRIHLSGCQNDHGLYIDAVRRLAFIACDQSATLLTLDLKTMKVTGHATLGPAPDVLAFDPGLRRLYVSAESGVVAAFGETAHGVRLLGADFLATEAHTVAVDPATHLVYFPLAGPNGEPHLLIMKPI
jgi:DNA-binding beta-propeller fold protein YncE